MTAKGRLLEYGSDWSVSRGDVIGFLGYNFAILKNIKSPKNQENVPNAAAGPAASSTSLFPSPLFRENGGGGDSHPTARSFGV